MALTEMLRPKSRGETDLNYLTFLDIRDLSRSISANNRQNRRKLRLRAGGLNPKPLLSLMAAVLLAAIAVAVWTMAPVSAKSDRLPASSTFSKSMCA